MGDDEEREQLFLPAEGEFECGHRQIWAVQPQTGQSQRVTHHGGEQGRHDDADHHGALERFGQDRRGVGADGEDSAWPRETCPVI